MNNVTKIVEALGFNPVLLDQDDDYFKKCLSSASALQRIKYAVLTSKPEVSGYFFICGESGKKDEIGLPEMVFVCPFYGMDGFAIYTKTGDYSAPSY
jgi:hypothetical protein